ncbi:MAG: twin transmembrane helix small protein [Thiotrichales bacterium]|nr:twin transmembrane helix small protein [Thiotrichales bacterium]
MSASVIFKIVVLLLIVLILISLTSGMVFLVRDKGQTNRTLNSLKFRIGLSVFLFILLFVGYRAGWIQPHGLLPVQVEKKALQ